MKSNRLLALAVLLIVAASFTPGLAQEHPAKAEHPPQVTKSAGRNDIIAALAANGDFKTLTAAIAAAGLTGTLQGKGPFTVFAPTDEAFAKLPAGVLDDLLKPANKAQLAGILGDHVVPGKLMAADIITMKATNVSGWDLGIANVGDGVVLVNDAKVVKTDIVADNGVIHAIDAVIIPADAAPAPKTEAPKDHPAH